MNEQGVRSVTNTSHSTYSESKGASSNEARQARPVLNSPEQNEKTPVKDQETTDTLKVKLLADNAKLPLRGSDRSAGYDLHAAEAQVVPSKGKMLVNTKIAIALPKGTYGRIVPRSGLAAKHMIDVGAGVIDEDYRGSLKVLLFNHGDQDYAVEEGSRIAQLIVERIINPTILKVDELDDTQRGEQGFGSTGGFHFV